MKVFSFIKAFWQKKTAPLRSFVFALSWSQVQYILPSPQIFLLTFLASFFLFFSAAADVLPLLLPGAMFEEVCPGNGGSGGGFLCDRCTTEAWQLLSCSHPSLSLSFVSPSAGCSRERPCLFLHPRRCLLIYGAQKSQIRPWQRADSAASSAPTTTKNKGNVWAGNTRQWAVTLLLR